jgi:lipoprotein NlpD
MPMNDERVRILGVALIALAVGGCVSRVPAPVEDRSRPRDAARPAAPVPAPPPDTYAVKRGDTLYSIALDQGVDWRELAALNQLADPTKLQTGQVLRVRPPQAPAAPPAESVVVSPIETVQPIVTRPLGAEPPAGAPSAPAPVATPAPAAGALKTEPKGVRLPYSEENLAALQRGDAARAAAPPKPEAPSPPPPKPETPAAAKPEAPAAVKPEPPTAPKPEADAAQDRVDWAWPASGKLVATFNGAASKGVDIAGRVGDPVYASAAGRVVYSGEGIPAYGKLVIIRHNSTYLSAYAHNSQILVKEGQNVARGQKIAEVGSTGADQAKLHFEIRRLGKPVDPLAYLPSRAN